MATMIPSTGPRDFAPASHEDMIYDALSRLPDDFYVVHSLVTSNVHTPHRSKDVREADFVVFNKDLGLLVIEAKAGAVSYRDGFWYYQSGLPMRNGGPYNQARSMMGEMLSLFHEKGLADVARRCRMKHAVWFLSLSRAELGKVNIPSEGDLDITLCLEDLECPFPAIKAIFDLPFPEFMTDLTDEEAREVVERVICPEFDIVPGSYNRHALEDIKFCHLLDSQKHILDFMAYQRTAVISGVAGSGKTLIAIEQATRRAERGRRVLLLCFNALLSEDIARRCGGQPNIDVKTAAAYACGVCRTPYPDYGALLAKLGGCTEDDFPYDDVVVDEGQDFGTDGNLPYVLIRLRELATGKEDGTFYLFYDKNQLIQGTDMPALVDDADCKMTLYVNCRNTENIARSAASALGKHARYKTSGKGPQGKVPGAVFTTDPDETAAYVDGCIADMRRDGMRDIAVLTCATLESSRVGGLRQTKGGRTYWRSTGVPFTTVRKFKGLEADAVILVDVTRDVWEPKGEYAPAEGTLYYTGASRAKFDLRVAFAMGESDCSAVVSELEAPARRRPQLNVLRALSLQPDL